MTTFAEHINTSSISDASPEMSMKQKAELLGVRKKSSRGKRGEDVGLTQAPVEVVPQPNPATTAVKPKRGRPKRTNLIRVEREDDEHRWVTPVEYRLLRRRLTNRASYYRRKNMPKGAKPTKRAVKGKTAKGVANKGARQIKISVKGKIAKKVAYKEAKRTTQYVKGKAVNIEASKVPEARPSPDHAVACGFNKDGSRMSNVFDDIYGRLNSERIEDPGAAVVEIIQDATNRGFQVGQQSRGHTAESVEAVERELQRLERDPGLLDSNTRYVQMLELLVGDQEAPRIAALIPAGLQPSFGGFLQQQHPHLIQDNNNHIQANLEANNPINVLTGNFQPSFMGDGFLVDTSSSFTETAWMSNESLATPTSSVNNPPFPPPILPENSLPLAVLPDPFSHPSGDWLEEGEDESSLLSFDLQPPSVYTPW